jgi:RimJ/RimL family protein N-acetyltransferase
MRYNKVAEYIKPILWRRVVINNLKQWDDNYQLVLLSGQHIETLFKWDIEEKHFENYTCRPFKLCNSYEEYSGKLLESISEGNKIVYVLVKAGVFNKPLGKITLFDLNTRNHSAEFGYYFPENNRGKGFGSIMLSKFIEAGFYDTGLNLNKLYATTSSNNYPSIKLLEKHGFTLDGRLREHYWINGNKYDQMVFSMLKEEWSNR